MNDNCIFCRIVKGEIPAVKVFETNEVLAFLDIGQVTLGHTLVIPKQHYDNFLAIPLETMHYVMDVAQRVGQAQMRQLLARGVNVLTNIGEVAGQSVMHAHIHVIPRYEKKDGFLIEVISNPDRDNLNLPAIADKIADGIK